mgnify:CR=1 FL=1
MRKIMKSLAVASVITVAAGLASALYAHESGGHSDAGSPMGRGGMMDMMRMMGNMGSMMEGCGQMMQGMKDGRDAEKPNEQWRPGEPAKPERSR